MVGGRGFYWGKYTSSCPDFEDAYADLKSQWQKYRPRHVEAIAENDARPVSCAYNQPGNEHVVKAPGSLWQYHGLLWRGDDHEFRFKQFGVSKRR